MKMIFDPDLIIALILIGLIGLLLIEKQQRAVERVLIRSGSRKKL